MLFGWIISTIVRNTTPVETSVPPGAIVAALLASCLTGVLFGMVTASQASRLDPVEALRYE